MNGTLFYIYEIRFIAKNAFGGLKSHIEVGLLFETVFHY